MDLIDVRIYRIYVSVGKIHEQRNRELIYVRKRRARVCVLVDGSLASLSHVQCALTHLVIQ